MDSTSLEFRYTRYQVPREALADAETRREIYLFKNVSQLRLTYQIRLLTFRASSEGKRLVIRVPTRTKLSADLRLFTQEASRFVKIEKTKE